MVRPMRCVSQDPEPPEDLSLLANAAGTFKVDYLHLTLPLFSEISFHFLCVM